MDPTDYDAEQDSRDFENEAKAFLQSPESHAFRILMETEPENVNKALRDAYMERSIIYKGYLIVLFEVAAEDNWTENQISVFWKTGVLSFLCQVACDPCEYVFTANNPEQIYLLKAVYSVLIYCIRSIIDEDKYTFVKIDSPVYVKEVVDRIPQLFDLLWLQRDLLRDDTDLEFYDPEDAEIFRRMVVSATHNLMMLHKAAPGKRKLKYPLYCYHHIKNILLLCWIYGEPDERDNILYPLDQMLENEGPAQSDQTLYRETINEEDLAWLFYDAICEELSRQDHVDEQLRSCLGITLFLSELIPSLPDDHPLLIDVDIVRCLALACQRQICSGSDDEVSNTHIICRALRVLFYIMRWRIKVENPVPFHDVPASYDLIPIISRHIPPIVKYGDKSLDPYILHDILRSFTVITETFCDDPEYAEDIERIYSLSRQVWYPTLQFLRSPPTNRSDFRKEILPIWQRFGRSLHLREYPPDMNSYTGHVAGCRWSKCLCYDNKPRCHSMKVCKGCWRALYCNVKCQTRDWNEGGHRETCKAVRELAIKY